MSGIGYLSYMGMAEETDYRTAVTVTDKIPIISEGIIEEYARIDSDYLDGKSGRREDDQGPLSVLGPTEVVLVHDEVDSAEFVGCNLPLAIAMGTATWDAGTGANQITLAESPDESATIAFEKTTSIHEIVSAMCKGFSISGAAGEDIRCSLDWIGYDYLAGGTTNASSDLNTLPTVVPSRLIFCDLTFRMATDMSDALAAGDKVAISAFTINYDAALSDPQFATGLNTASNPYGTVCGKTLKPERNGFREVTMELTIPRYAADTWRTAMANDSAIQADFTFTASATRNFYIYLPYLKVMDVSDPIESADIITETVTLKAFRGASYNAGAGNTVMKFTDASTVIAEEFAIETDNDRTAAIIT